GSSGGDHGGGLLARQAPNILINGNPVLVVWDEQGRRFECTAGGRWVTLTLSCSFALIFARRVRYLLMLRTSLPTWRSAMTFKRGISGNPHGNRHRTRHLLNQEFMQALLLHFRQHGKKAIEKVAREQPASYLKILGLLVPREHKVEH